MTNLASRAQLRASFARWALFLVPLVLLLGFLSGEVAGSGPDNPWFAALVKPLAYPPPEVFGPVWSALYVLIGLAAALVCAAWGAKGRTAALVLFVVQLALNLAWSPLFFMFHQMLNALYLLGALDAVALLTLILFWRVRWLAGLLFLPYVAWIGFATFLNWQFLVLNPQVDGVRVSGAVQRIELKSQDAPVDEPVDQPSDAPAVAPSDQPTAQPAGAPAVTPAAKPSAQPPAKAAEKPAEKPAARPAADQSLNPPPGAAT